MNTKRFHISMDKKKNNIKKMKKKLQNEFVMNITLLKSFERCYKPSIISKVAAIALVK